MLESGNRHARREVETEVGGWWAPELHSWYLSSAVKLRLCSHSHPKDKASGRSELCWSKGIKYPLWGQGRLPYLHMHRKDPWGSKREGTPPHNKCGHAPTGLCDGIHFSKKLYVHAWGGSWDQKAVRNRNKITGQMQRPRRTVSHWRGKFRTHTQLERTSCWFCFCNSACSLQSHVCYIVSFCVCVGGGGVGGWEGGAGMETYSNARSWNLPHSPLSDFCNYPAPVILPNHVCLCKGQASPMLCPNHCSLTAVP